jgi:hypothetical protein
MLFGFCLCRDGPQGWSSLKQASLHVPKKKTPMLTIDAFHLNLTNIHKLENKIQPQ